MIATGAVGPTWVKLWLRSERPGVLLVEYWPEKAPETVHRAIVEVPESNLTDNTTVITLPHLPSVNGPLQPMTRYCYRIRHVGAEVSAAILSERWSTGDPQVSEHSAVFFGEGHFETAPESLQQLPQRFALGLMSCNQPFDANGGPKAEGAAMLRAARLCLAQHDTKLVFTVGDQMYTDYPEKLSLFNADHFSRIAPEGRERIEQCSPVEVRRILHERHRHFWNFEGWRTLHADYPCYPILDDHELVDNWGSHADHVTPAWQGFFDGARAAYFDYQGARVTDANEPPQSFDYEVEYGALAVYTLDLRSNRTAGENGRIYSDRQMARLKSFLEKSADRQIVFLVLSVPLVHLPRWVARLGRIISPPGEDFSDRWSTMGHVRDRDRLFRLLHDHQRDHPQQRLVLLSGDIHLGCVHEIAWQDGTRPLVQFISSGITNNVSLGTRIAAQLSIRWKSNLTTQCGLHAVVRTMAGEGAVSRNPYGKLNLGIVEFERMPDSPTLPMRFRLYGHRGDHPVCVFSSPWT